MEMTVQGSAGQAFVVYSHIGVSSRVTGEGAAEGTLRLRDDLRGPAGPLAAPLIVMVLDSAATATLPLASAIPTRVDVEVFGVACGVDTLRLCGWVRRRGRSQIYYDARIEDAAESGRLVGHGSVTMAVTGPPVAEYVGHSARGSAEPAVRSGGRALTEVFEGRPVGDGRYEVAPLTPRIGFGRLHAGVQTVMAEAAATEAVRSLVDGRPVRTERLEAQLLTGGKVGPFSVVPEVLAVDGDHATCRVEVVDQGAGSRLVSLIVGRLGLVDAGEGPCTPRS
jgi:acyl-coenzyme A thioesterase PaaI-like protein